MSMTQDEFNKQTFDSAKHCLLQIQIQNITEYEWLTRDILLFARDSRAPGFFRNKIVWADAAPWLLENKDDLLAGQQSSDVNLATEMKLKKMRGYDLDNERKELQLNAEKGKFYLVADVEKYLVTLGTIHTNILSDKIPDKVLVADIVKAFSEIKVPSYPKKLNE